ncbi:uncharacterized protein [Miscanthus floridulus]|uniref:uncharacterized protein n=1 Tax=Miscanthus floridulus TaxID=154761 RepID=UPI003457F564
MVPRASASSPALLGGGGGAVPGSAIARPRVEADTPEARALGKRAISPKRPAEVPTLAPLKVLKVNPSSTAYWVAEAQAALQRGAASARDDPKEPATQGGATEAASTQTGEGAPTPHEGKARKSDRAKVPSATEAAEVEVPLVSEAEAAEAGAPRTIEATTAGAGAPTTTEATTAEAGAPGTTEATMAEAGALGTTEADVIAARPSA